MFTLKNLRGDVVRSTTDGSFALSIKLEFGSKTKVTNLDLHLLVEEEITKLEISMDDPMRVEVLDSIANLHDVALNLQLMKTLTSPE